MLVLSPHVDDGEIGCGGTIARMVEQGDEVFYVAFSDARISVPEGFPKDALVNELKEAGKILGLEESHIQILSFETRNFPAKRQEILDEIIVLKKDISPEIIFTPTQADVHQDHQTITNEALRAFKRSSVTLRGYEEPWNCFNFSTSAFIHLTEEQGQKKMRALAAYKSQAHRGYLNRDFVFGLAQTRGTQIGTKYAEAFELIRWVLT